MSAATPSRRTLAEPAASWLAGLLLAAALGLHVRAAWTLLPADLTAPDPPAHFTTGVLVHDYLRTQAWENPVAFAECFYIHYPKVALGHWPPFFYVLESLWFLVFGPAAPAARALCGAITLGVAGVLFALCRRTLNLPLAIGAAAVFLAAPLVQRQGWTVMTDILVGGLVCASLWSLCAFLDQPSAGHATLVAVFSVLAILTKGTAWLLIAPALAAPLLTGRTGVYARIGFWVMLAAIVAGGAPFYLWSSAAGFGYPLKLAGHLHRLAVLLAARPLIWAFAGLVLLPAAAVAAFRLRPQTPLSIRATIAVLFVCWITTQAILITVLPLTPEGDRYWTPSLAPAVYLIGLMALQFVRPVPAWSVAVAVALFLIWAWPPRLDGSNAYSRAAGLLPASGTPAGVLVDSDAAGEGALIAAQLVRDPGRDTFMVRSSKLLATSEWSGSRYRSRFQDPAAMLAELDRLAVNHLVLDTSAPAQPHSATLRDALSRPQAAWSLAGRIPVQRRHSTGELLIYRRSGAPALKCCQLTIDLGPERSSRRISCPDTAATPRTDRR